LISNVKLTKVCWTKCHLSNNIRFKKRFMYL